MAAPRASSFKALRNLQRVSSSIPASSRGLHMTGVHAAPQRIDPTHKTTYIPWNLQDLRNECRTRTLTPSGTKPELIDRLAAHDSLQARAFSMAMRRITKDQTKKTISGPADTTPQRTFNTSRANKVVNDTSTIDFAYLPKLFQGEFAPQPAAIRVPILPHVVSDEAEATLDKFPELDAAAGAYQDTDAGVKIMKPQIEAADPHIITNFSVMSDVQDASPRELSVDVLAKLSETVSQSARQVASAVTNTGKSESEFRQVWNGFLDDVFGAQKPPARA